MEQRSHPPEPGSCCFDLDDIPDKPSALEDPETAMWNNSLLRSKSTEHLGRRTQLPASTQPSEPSSIEQALEDETAKTTFRIRTTAPRINLMKSEGTFETDDGRLADIFSNFDAFVRRMIDKGEDVNSEAELYLKLLSDYLEEEPETIQKYTKIEIRANTSHLSLQSFGNTLKNLVELKLNDSVIHSVRDIGTSFKSVRVLWLSRCGLQDLAGTTVLKPLIGLLAFQGLEELYASFNFVRDLSDIAFVDKLSVLDLEANNVTELQQLAHLTRGLKALTLAGNPVAQDPNYFALALSHGPGLQTVDDVSVSVIKATLKEGIGKVLASPVPRDKKGTRLRQDDSAVVERYKQLGIGEELVRESIKAAQELLGSEPPQEEILRQSIKAQGLPGDKKGKLVPQSQADKSPTQTRPATAVSAAWRRSRQPLGTLQEVQEEAEAEDQEAPRVEGFSELVTTTDQVFVGNPLKAARHKQERTHGLKLDIFSLINQFKQVPSALDLALDPVLDCEEEERPDRRGPLKAANIITIKRIKSIKHKP